MSVVFLSLIPLYLYMFIREIATLWSIDSITFLFSILSRSFVFISEMLQCTNLLEACRKNQSCCTIPSDDLNVELNLLLQIVNNYIHATASKKLIFYFRLALLILIHFEKFVNQTVMQNVFWATTHNWNQSKVSQKWLHSNIEMEKKKRIY